MKKCSKNYFNLFSIQIKLFENVCILKHKNESGGCSGIMKNEKCVALKAGWNIQSLLQTIKELDRDISKTLLLLLLLYGYNRTDTVITMTEGCSGWRRLRAEEAQSKMTPEMLTVDKLHLFSGFDSYNNIQIETDFNSSFTEWNKYMLWGDRSGLCAASATVSLFPLALLIVPLGWEALDGVDPHVQHPL